MAKKPTVETLRKRFNRAIKPRLKAEHNRMDVVKWLAEQLHSSESYVSHTLNNQTPRRYGDGRPMNFWRRLCAILEKDEIAILEEMEK